MVSPLRETGRPGGDHSEGGFLFDVLVSDGGGEGKRKLISDFRISVEGVEGLSIVGYNQEKKDEITIVQPSTPSTRSTGILASGRNNRSSPAQTECNTERSL